jgi:hypothetical protein
MPTLWITVGHITGGILMLTTLGIVFTIFSATYYIGLIIAFFVEGDIYETRIEMLLSILPFGYVFSRLYREYKELPWR